ncbi:MAG: helix-turn-helix domain-containing protein [Edaphobacter sp.]
MNDVGNLKDWISQAAAARIRGVSQERIRQLVNAGRLQSIDVAGRKLVRQSEVEAFVPMPEGRPLKRTAKKKASAKKKAGSKKFGAKKKTD